MAKARRCESWDHTSMIFFGLRLFMTSLASGLGATNVETPSTTEIHPFYQDGTHVDDAEPVTPEQRQAAKQMAARLSQVIAEARAARKGR